MEAQEIAENSDKAIHAAIGINETAVKLSDNVEILSKMISKFKI